MRMQDNSSLGSLSRRFLELIEETEDGILDLRRAAECLQVRSFLEQLSHKLLKLKYLWWI